MAEDLSKKISACDDILDFYRVRGGYCEIYVKKQWTFSNFWEIEIFAPM